MRNAARLCTPGPSLWSVLLLCVPALCVFASPSGAPKPGQASGSFSVDGTAVALRYAYAMVQPDVFDEKKTNTAILLTARPLPDAALAGAKDLESAARGETN